MKTKNAVFFGLSLFLIAAIAITWSFVALSAKYKNKDSGTFLDIGERQFEIVKSVLEGEKALLYLDQSAEYAARQAAYDMGQHGGFAVPTRCGRFGGYSVWHDGQESCAFTHYSEIESNFSRLFNRNMDSFIKQYFAEGYEVPLENYDVILPLLDNQRTSVLGFATQNIVTSTNDLVPRGRGDFFWPVQKTKPHISSCFGYRGCVNVQTQGVREGLCGGTRFHQGIDIRTKQKDEEVLAVAKGTVVHINKEWGKVAIYHGEGLLTEYIHMKDIAVSEGDSVLGLQKIGVASDVMPGTMTSVHLHFGVREGYAPEDEYSMENGFYVNPIPYFKKDTGIEYGETISLSLIHI